MPTLRQVMVRVGGDGSDSVPSVRLRLRSGAGVRSCFERMPESLPCVFIFILIREEDDNNTSSLSRADSKT